MSEATTPLFEIRDEHELLALWRLVAEAKFQSDPDDTDLWGSPYVHSLSKRIGEALLQCTEAKGDALRLERHLQWKASLESNVVLSVVKKNLQRDATQAAWKTWTRDEKVTYLRDCVAPFEVSDALAEQLIHEAESSGSAF
jgi:hypothetical protein